MYWKAYVYGLSGRYGGGLGLVACPDFKSGGGHGLSAVGSIPTHSRHDMILWGLYPDNRISSRIKTWGVRFFHERVTYAGLHPIAAKRGG